MDDLTRERYGPGIPYAEGHARPRRLRPPPTPLAVLRERQIILCGTSDIDIEAALARDRRLAEAIRAYQAARR